MWYSKTDADRCGILSFFTSELERLTSSFMTLDYPSMPVQSSLKQTDWLSPSKVKLVKR